MPPGIVKLVRWKNEIDKIQTLAQEAQEGTSQRVRELQHFLREERSAHLRPSYFGAKIEMDCLEMDGETGAIFKMTAVILLTRPLSEMSLSLISP